MTTLLSETMKAIYDLDGELVRSDENAVVFRPPESSVEITVDLGSMRRVTVGLSPEEIQVRVRERVAAAVRAAGASQGLNLDDILPHLRPPGSEGPWSRPLVADHLRICMVEDGPVTMRYLRPTDLVQSALGLAALDARSRDNLFRIAPQGAWCPEPALGEAVVSSKVGDGHDAARALVVERWFPAEDRILFLVPSRDHLWVVPGSIDGAEAMATGLKEVARRVALEATYPLSDQVFVNEGGSIRSLRSLAP